MIERNATNPQTQLWPVVCGFVKKKTLHARGGARFVYFSVQHVGAHVNPQIGGAS